MFRTDELGEEKCECERKRIERLEIEINLFDTLQITLNGVLTLSEGELLFLKLTRTNRSHKIER